MGLHVLSILIKNLKKNTAQIFFTITWQNNSFLAWIDWPCAFNFRICFGQTLVAYDFDGKLTQSFAQIFMQYHVSKDFLCLHFAFDQVLSISGNDLENQSVPCKQKYWIKNMAVKIPILILPTFVEFAKSLLQLQVVLIK